MGSITFWQPNHGYLNVLKAIGLATVYALEMDMLVMMLGGGTMLLTEGVFKTTGVIEHFVNHTPVKKGS